MRVRTSDSRIVTPVSRDGRGLQLLRERADLRRILADRFGLRARIRTRRPCTGRAGAGWLVRRLFDRAHGLARLRGFRLRRRQRHGRPARDDVRMELVDLRVWFIRQWRRWTTR